MNKAEFLHQLEQLLSDIAPYERTEALNYYEEYFTDAGAENEQRILLELGSPRQVAQSIREGLQPRMPYGNNSSAQVPPYADVPPYKEVPPYTETPSYAEMPQYSNSNRAEKSSLPTWAVVLIVIGCIFASPVLLGLFAAAVGLLIGFFGVIIGFGAAGLATVVAGISVVFAGIINCALFPMAGIVLAGAGLIVFALGILFIMFTVWLCGFALPAIFRGIKSLFRKKQEN